MSGSWMNYTGQATITRVKNEARCQDIRNYFYINYVPRTIPRKRYL